MQGVLYVSHGSRVEEATDEAISCIHAANQNINTSLWEICFLELADPTVIQGIDKLVQRGATSIVIIPVLLLSAGHYYKDIPDEIDKARNHYPNTSFVYGQPLGVQDRIVDVLVERLEEADIAHQTNANILLVGRGSRNPETKRDIETIAQKLKTKLKIAEVDVCYLAAISPTFEEGLNSSLKKSGSQTFVVPYLWFTGILIQSMQKQINELRNADEEIVLCHYLDHHPIMVQALADRVNEALHITSRDNIKLQ